MTDWPELQSMWEMDWGSPRGKEAVRVVEHEVPMMTICVETRDGVTWVPLDIFKRYATPVAEGLVIEPNMLRTWVASKTEPVREFKAWHT